jgi:hypothetical protein
MIERLFDKPPNAAIPSVNHFFAEVWSRSEIESFVAFGEEECRNAAARLAEQGEPDGSSEYTKINQILHHLRGQAWRRSQQLSKIDSINSRVRRRLNQ